MKAKYGISVEVGPNDWRKANLILDGKEGETPEELLDRTADTVELWFKHRHTVVSHHPANELKEIIAEKPLPEEERLALMIGDMLKCTRLEGNDGLLSFKNWVEREKKPDITQAYELMLKKLS